MGVREEIIESLLVWDGLMRQLAVDGLEGDSVSAARELRDRDIPSFLRMVRSSVPIRIDVSGEETFAVAWDFGVELSEFTESGDSDDVSLRIGYVRQPYDFCLYHGEFFPVEGDIGGSKFAILVGALGDRQAYEVMVYAFRRSVRHEVEETQVLWSPIGAGIYASPEFRRLVLKEGDVPGDVRGEFAGLGDEFALGPTRFTPPNQRDDDAVILRSKHAVWGAIQCFVAAYGLLHMKQYDRHDIPAPEKLNRKRERSGKEPISQRIEIRLNPQYRTLKAPGGTHASPRPHWRRGHVRTLASGKRVPVSPHLVMGEAPMPEGYWVKK